MTKTLTPTILSDAAGISVPYASQILNGHRVPSRAMALRIFDRTGRKFGSLAQLSDDDVQTLVRIEQQHSPTQTAA